LLKDRISKVFDILLLSACAIPICAQETSQNTAFKQGWYLGLTTGVISGSSAVNTTIYNSPHPYIGTDWLSRINQAGAGTINLNTPTGGIVGGYNWKIGNYLVGWELDFSSLALNNTRFIAMPFDQNSPNQDIFTITNTVQTDWLSTFRYRFGFTFERLLVYATTGLAITQFSTHTIYSDPALNDPVYAGYITNYAKDTKVGWTAGAGMEWMLTEKWSVKAEYLFVSFSDLLSSGELIIIAPLDPSQILSHTFNFSANLQLNIIRAGIVYHF
jgi:outer membrane immunogenic protein